MVLVMEKGFFANHCAWWYEQLSLWWRRKGFFFFFSIFFWWSTEPYGIRNFCFIPKGVKPRDLDPPMKGKHFARVYAIDHAMSQLSWTLPTFYSLDMDHGLSIFCPILCSSTVHLSENQISNDGCIVESILCYSAEKVNLIVCFCQLVHH
jgi:hypothetical protein